MRFLKSLPDTAHLRDLPEEGAPKTLELPRHEGWAQMVHELDRAQALAIHTALATQRPLLVQGEPGTGKTQLARAAAVGLGWHFVHQTLDARTEVGELFWRLDAVRRLGEAQMLGPGDKDRSKLDVRRFVEPGLFWWGFDWAGARRHLADCHVPEEGAAPRDVASVRAPAPWVPEQNIEKVGSVILVDEVDKADPFLPNALLEVLGERRFDGPSRLFSVKPTKPVLVVITTNRQRALSPAFMRRCIVLDLHLEGQGDLVDLFVSRGRLHMDHVWKHHLEPDEADDALETKANVEDLDEALLRSAAERVVRERSERRSDPPSPGQDEFLSLAKALYLLRATNTERMALLEDIAPFVLQKGASGISP